MKPLEDYTMEDILIEARSSLNKLKKDTEFSLRDLFKIVEWTSFPASARKSAGKAFKVQVESGKLPVVFTEKTSSNLAVYQKT